MKTENPFIVSGYKSEEYFCDRKTETARLIDAIINRRNITILSLRRIGKTGIIHHAFHKLQKKYCCIYIDIMPTSNIEEFLNIFGNEVFKQLDSFSEKFLKNIASIFGSVTPTLNFDKITGQPSMSFPFKNRKEIDITVEHIFAHLKKQKKKIVIAIDEFQQIAKYPEKNVEALLRSHIQNCPNVSFVFSGSQKNMLTTMFSSQSKPFYQSSEFLHLEKIPAAEYLDFIATHFANARKKINSSQINLLLDWCKRHTWHVQYVCNRLFSLSSTHIVEKNIVELFDSILQENETIYFNYRNLITDFQWKLLRSIAKEDGVTQPNAKAFIEKYKLGTPSSINTALHSLIDKELIFHDNNIYMVYDVFFSRWLAKQ